MSLTSGTRTVGIVFRGDDASLRQTLQSSATGVQQFATRTTQSLAGAGRAAQDSAQKIGTSSQQSATSVQRSSSSIASASRQASSGMRETAQQAQSMGNQVSTAFASLSGSLGRIAGVAGLGYIAKEVASVGIGFNDFTQKAQISLETLLGSGDKAREFLSDMLTFAKQTPFALPDLTESAQRLLAFGVEGEQVIPILRSIGDAATAAGKGTAGVQQLALVLGQIQAKGRLQGDEILQLAENGVNALAILANQANMTTADFQKEVTAGNISAEQAISGLIDGIQNGTDGINGATAQMGGLMEQIKGSGGWTATLDSAKSAFRNAAGAVTENLLPSLISLLRTGTDALGVVQGMAEGFGKIPAPLQNAALASTAFLVANRLMGNQLREVTFGQLVPFRGSLNAARAELDAAGGSATRQQIAIATLKNSLSGAAATAKSFGSSLLGAFGGPVGLAITGVAATVAALASAQADAKQRVQELVDTMDELGQVTDSTRQSVIETLTTDTGSVFTRHETAADAAEKLGISLTTLTDAALGSVDALREVDEATPYAEGLFAGGEADRADQLGLSYSDYANSVRTVRDAVRGSNADLEEAIRVAQQKVDADGAVTESTDTLAGTYNKLSQAIAEVSEEQQKVLDSAADAARSAFDSATNLARLDLNTSTDDDLAAAQDKVSESARRVRDAEASLADTRARKKVSANDIIRAEEAVSDARKQASEAADELTEVESRRDPVANYRREMEEMLSAAQTFTANIQSLADQGLNAQTLQELISAGPEGSKEQIDALLADSSLIGLTNSTQDQMNTLGAQLEGQSRVAQAAIQNTGGNIGGYLGLGMKIAAEEGAVTTVQALADKLGEDPQTIYSVANMLGLEFVRGFSDAMDSYGLRTIRPDGSVWTGSGNAVGMADGGIYPGYTPGRDIGFIGISGGEAVMRPEWTRAVGSNWVHQMNALARTGGVSAVREAMAAYRGGYSNGGVVGSSSTPVQPNVITVPVAVTNERHDPQTFTGDIVLRSMEDLRPWANRQKARRNLTGRR